MSNIVKKTYQIEGMHCSSCAMSVDWALEDLPGVKEAKTSYAKGKTEVAFDPERVDDSAITAVITAEGFTVSAA
jgi:copper chaperone CopZ